MCHEACLWLKHITMAAQVWSPPFPTAAPFLPLCRLRSVPYCTAAIKLESEYATAHPIPLSPDLPSIVRPSTATASRVTPAPSTYVPPAVTAANGSVTAGAGGVTAGCGAVTAHDEEPDPATPASQAGDVAQPLTGPHKSQPEVAHPKRKVHGRWASSPADVQLYGMRKCSTCDNVSRQIKDCDNS